MKIDSWADLMELKKTKQLKKENSIVDSKRTNISLLARNLMNVVLFARQEHKTNTFQLPIPYIRASLNIKSHDYKLRIEKALLELATPIALRDFTHKGKEISYVPAALLIEPIIYKDKINFVDIKVSELFVSAVEKSGFTILELRKLLDCSSIYSHELAQMLIRYKDLPNKVNNGIGRLKRSIEQLNELFGTKYKYQSELSRKIDKAKKDIKDIFNFDFFYFYDDIEKVFIFSWEKVIELDICIFPKTRILELATWIYDHYKDKDSIDDKDKFINRVRRDLKNNTWDNAEAKYRGMLQRKYKLDPDVFYDKDTHKYIDFKEKK